MFSKNIPSLLSISGILFIAVIIGIHRSPDRQKLVSVPPLQEQIDASVPSIGRIQVLNGCGSAGAAEKMTDFMRMKKFNVANTGNASSWNYPFTLVVSHTNDMTIANQIAAVLTTGHVVLMRKEDHAYDVTVIIGPDYEEKIR